jgi:hypothetical protein
MKKFFKALGTVLFLMAAFSYMACKDEDEKTENKSYCQVVFVTNGASSIESQKVEVGKQATAPEEPKKSADDGENYFGGWYTNEELTEKYDFSATVSKDIVLYAKWLSVPEGSYLVTFDSKCDTKIDDQIVKEGEKASEPKDELSKTGFAFSHWYEEGTDNEFDFANTAITDTTELKAKWNESGIYEAQYEDESLYLMNVYENLEADSESGAW